MFRPWDSILRIFGNPQEVVGNLREFVRNFVISLLIQSIKDIMHGCLAALLVLHCCSPRVQLNIGLNTLQDILLSPRNQYFSMPENVGRKRGISKRVDYSIFFSVITLPSRKPYLSKSKIMNYSVACVNRLILVILCPLFSLQFHVMARNI